MKSARIVPGEYGFAHFVCGVWKTVCGEFSSSSLSIEGPEGPLRTVELRSVSHMNPQKAVVFIACP